jgi:hypothetical protein
MTQTITIAGREFKGAKNSTMEHDVFVQGMIARAGLDRLEMKPGETSEDFALRIFRKAAVESDVFLLLGSLLFPADLEPANWNPHVAAETAQFLRKLTADEDKKIVRGQIIGALMGFFQSGLAYGVISPNSSRPEYVQIDESNQSGDLASMENGPESSAPSPVTM